MIRFGVDLMGVNQSHELGYVVDHSHTGRFEHNTYELMCFASPVEILTVNGMERCETGDIILHTPEFRIHHYTPAGARVGFVNDWLYVVSSQMPDFIRYTNIPTNALIHAGDPMAMRNALNEITNELLHRRPYYQEFISTIVERLLVSVARLAQEQTMCVSALGSHLTALRQQLMREYAKPWTVQEMADHLNLSCSRFSVLYRQQFGISPINDLIEMRLQEARMLLKSTQRTLRQIAQDCGFQNEYYFSKVFKSRTGIPPSKYRG